MINPKVFFQCLLAHNVDFFTGVPDSLLKNVCAYITDNTSKENHIIAANEGNALSLGIGHYLATKRIPLIYLQNSGLGNVINPLLSLADPDVYSIPMILMIGWRGEPGVKDEPQHKKQGRVTESLLKSMEIPYKVLTKGMNNIDTENAISDMYSTSVKKNTPCALLIRKGFFSDYSLKSEAVFDRPTLREDAIKIVINKLSDSDIVVSTTGVTSRELFEYRGESGKGHSKDFLTVGGMGHASQIALGISLRKPDKQVVCMDGDGALLMHMGSLAINASMECCNFKHVVFNNSAHDSVGGQPTVASNIDIPAIALASGYRWAKRAVDIDDINQFMDEFLLTKGPALLEVQVKKGFRSNLGRPTLTPIENKEAFMKFLDQ